ncbi:ABC transporter substrate-binding protein [bacterium]|nr:ABC transporter substrate-binding protein [bacterium]
MQTIKKFSSILIVILLFTIALSACGSTETNVTNEPVANNTTDEVAPTDEPVAEEPAETEAVDTPLIVAYNAFSQKFSPYYADTGYDQDVVGMTQIGLMTTDRVGGIIYNAIEGETVSYNGTDYLYTGPADISVAYDPETDTTKYTATLRQDMVFSDGEPVTADDVIFTYYTYLDPSYVGSTSLSSYDIVGLKDYQTQTTSDVYDKYSALFDEIYAAGRDHEWSDADGWTQEQQDDVWASISAAVMTETEGIISYVMQNYLDYAPDYFNAEPDEITASEGMQVAYAMRMWGFASRDDETGALTGAATGTEWDLVENFPTVDDYYNEILVAYDYDIAEAFPYESANETDVLANVRSSFIGFWGPQDESMGTEGVPNVSGIVKVDDYTVEVTTNGYEAPAVYSILGLSITPMHYYGDAAKYDYANNMFGFDFGDLSKQESLTATPLGAGPYKYVKYENKVVYFEANELYWRGAPKIKEIQFKETVTAEVASAVQTGTADAGELSGTTTRIEEIKSYNSNGEITGDIITTSLVDNLGYGYIGFNASTMLVGDDPASEASKDLRKGFATIMAAHRDTVIDSYYGELAAVINYPITNTSWAAPQATDEGYKVAFSEDVNGDPIYTADMTTEEKYAAAQEAALGFFEAAGFTVEDGMLTAAPEGAKLSYEVLVPADGTGDHPAFGILTAAQESLAAIGMELVINDLTDTAVLWQILDAATQEMWTAAWGSTIDPDMYQVYYSGNVVGEGGSDSNHYHITSPELDQLIIDARLSDDQNYRKAVYKQALDVIMDWAVELPTYNRSNLIIFSTERINIGTLTPDITTYWGWMNDIELLEMN